MPIQIQVAKFDLLNTDTASGTSVINIQREHNGSASFSGRTLNGAKDELPLWSSNTIGAASDSLKVRQDNVQAQVESNTTSLANKIDKVVSTDNAVTRYDGTSGAVQDSGVTIDDSDNVIIPGDLTVNGTTTTINTATLDVEDANILINSGGTQATADSVDAGLTVSMSDATDVLIGYDSTLTSRFKCGDVGSEAEIVTVDVTQTLTNKTTSNLLNNGYIEYDEIATPATPGTGKNRLYFKSDASLYRLDDAGAEIEVGAGGGGGDLGVRTESSNYTVLTTDNVILSDTSGGAFTITLYTASGNAGKVVYVKKTTSDFNAITVDGNGTETIDGATTTTVDTIGETLYLVSDGTNWQILERRTSTGWIDYTATITGFGTPTIDCTQWKRSGNKCQLRMVFSSGTATAVNAQVTIPNSANYTITNCSADTTFVDCWRLLYRCSKYRKRWSYNSSKR